MDRSAPPIADAHLDLLLELAYRELLKEERGAFASAWLPKLEAGGVALQVCPIYVDLPFQPESALRQALGQVAVFNRAVAENPERVVAVRTAADLDDRRLGLVLALEGVEAFGYDPWTAEVFHALGVRMASLTWNRRNPFADGNLEEGGLSMLGRELVDLLVELGVVLDLAHTSERTFWEALERTGDAPVVVSHAACRAVRDHPRNVTDEQLRALADRGGMLGIMCLPAVIDAEEWTVERVCDHVEHAIGVMGVDHVGLGGDFTRQLVETMPVVTPQAMKLGTPLGAAIEGLAGPEDWPALVAALRRRGYEGDELAAVCGGNLRRVLRRALTG